MKNFFVGDTKLTPEVSFDIESNVFTFKGNSIPENSNSFYFPILEWIDTHTTTIASNKNKLHITIDLEYFNSSSLKQLVKVLMKCVDVVPKRDIHVIWYCDNPTDDFLETGEDISAALNVPFDFKFRK